MIASKKKDPPEGFGNRKTGGRLQQLLGLLQTGKAGRRRRRVVMAWCCGAGEGEGSEQEQQLQGGGGGWMDGRTDGWDEALPPSSKSCCLPKPFLARCRYVYISPSLLAFTLYNGAPSLPHFLLSTRADRRAANGPHDSGEKRRDAEKALKRRKVNGKTKREKEKKK